MLLAKGVSQGAADWPKWWRSKFNTFLGRKSKSGKDLQKA
jgi:hypothetical protein